MKTIIALKGIEKCGKSTSIRKVYTILKKKYPDINILLEIISKSDVKAIIIIGVVIIGIESQGDPTSRLPESLKEFEGKGCHIILCATRTYGATVNAVISMANEYTIEWVNKFRTKESVMDLENEKMANMLVDKIEILLTAV